MLNVMPDKEAAFAMTGQMCSAGRFTTVTLADQGDSIIRSRESS